MMMMMMMMNTQADAKNVKNPPKKAKMTTEEMLASKIESVQRHAIIMNRRIYKSECAIDELTKFDNDDEFQYAEHRRASARAKFFFATVMEHDQERETTA